MAFGYRPDSADRALAFPVGRLITVLLVVVVNRLVTQAQGTQHSERVLPHTHRLEKTVLDRETGLRGYFITQDPGFLDPYQRPETNVILYLHTLEALVSDNPSQTLRIERMGGKLGLRSQAGQGSTFWIELPLWSNQSSSFGLS